MSVASLFKCFSTASWLLARPPVVRAVLLGGMALVTASACFQPRPFPISQDDPDVSGGAAGAPGVGGAGGQGGASCDNGAYCYTGSPGTAGKGLCAAGKFVCAPPAEPVCADEILPSVEICIPPGEDTPELDENCDGVPACSGDGVFTVGLGLLPAAEGMRVLGGQHGEILIVGTQRATGTSAQMFLARFSAEGQPLGEPILIGDDESTSVLPGGMVAAPDGSVLVSGFMMGSATLGGQQVTSAAGAVFLARWLEGSSLSLLHVVEVNMNWARPRVTVDGEGNIFLLSRFAGTVDLDKTDPNTGELTTQHTSNLLVAKLDPTGRHLWSRALAATADADDTRPGGIVFDPGTRDVLVAGSFSGRLDPDGQGNASEIVSAGDHDIFLLRLSGAMGEVVWTKRFGNNQRQQVDAVALDQRGDLLLVGGFRGVLDLGGDPPLDADNDVDSMFIAKLSGIGGAYRWALSSPSAAASAQRARAIAVDGADQVVVTGTSTGDLGPGLCGSVIGNADLPDDDVFVLKLTPEGTCIWARRPGHTGDQVGEGIAVEPLGGVLVTGRFEQSLDFGGGTIPTAVETDAFLARLVP